MDLLSVIGIEQLKKININYKKRQRIWNLYYKNFKQTGLKIPSKFNSKIMKHSFHLFNIFLKKERDGISRDEAILRLHRKKIGVGIHYRSIPEHSIYRKKFKWKINDYPNAKKIGRETLSLPLSPSLTKNEVLKVIKNIKSINK